MSTPKYRPLIEMARDRGFEIRMLYVVLGSANLQLERIRMRVLEGGHDVPAGKVIDRRKRSFEQLAMFCKHIDRLAIFNNSTGEPSLSAYKRAKKPLHVVGSLPSDLMSTLTQWQVPMQL